MWQKIFRNEKKGPTFTWLWIVVWLLAIAIRLYGATTPAQYYDMGTFHSWAITMDRVGPTHFFSSTWSDYMPLPLYTLVPVLWISTATHLSFDLVFKLMMSTIELTLIYFIARSLKHITRYKGIIVLLLLSPVLIGNTAFWGQVDTIPALMTLLSLLLITPGVKKATSHTGCVIFSATLFGLSVAYKPIMLVALPVFLVIMLRRSFFPSILYFLTSLAAFLVTAMPMNGSGNPATAFILLFSRALSQSGTYPYTTINAWNLWSVIPHPSSWPPDNQIVLGLSAHTFGLILFSLAAVYTLLGWRKAKWDRKYVFRIVATLLIAFYTFTTRMHERHLLFGIPALAIAVAFDTWLIIPYTILTITYSINLWAAFYWVNNSQTWPVAPWVMGAVSWVNVLTTFAMVMVWDWPKYTQKIRLWLSRNKMLFLVLCLASFLRIYNLSYPKVYIFDEVYHAFTAREYLHNNKAAWEWWTTPPKGVAYEWTHPPVAKYGMVAGMLLFGEDSFGWRIGSAIAGVLSVLGLYKLVLTLTKNRRAALLSAFFVSIEGLHLSQSRIGMNDMYMLVFYVWSLYLAVKSRWKWSAILFGLSLASKWSALYGIIPLGIVYLHEKWSLLRAPINILRAILHTLRLLLIVIIIYILAFTPFFVIGHTWGQWWELQRQMWYYHTHLKATHAYQSIPLQWIFDIRPVWYYVDYGKSVISNIYAQGNPLVLWLGLVSFVMLLPKIRKYPYLLLSASYLIFTVPWAFSPRIMFFYHYLPSAFFLCSLLALWLSEIPRKVWIACIALCVVCFIFLIPVYYGTPMPHWYWNSLFSIMPSWK